MGTESNERKYTVITRPCVAWLKNKATATSTEALCRVMQQPNSAAAHKKQFFNSKSVFHQAV